MVDKEINTEEIQQPKKPFYGNCYMELIETYRENVNNSKYSREGDIKMLAYDQIHKKNFLDAESIIVNDLFDNDNQITLLLKLAEAMSTDKKDYSHLAPEIKNRIEEDNKKGNIDYFLEYLNIFKNDYDITKDEISVAQRYVDDIPVTYDYGRNKKIYADQLNELISSLPISTNTKITQ